MKDKETESELSKDGTETSNIGTESDSESGFNSLNGACTSKPFILFLFTKKKKREEKRKNANSSSNVCTHSYCPFMVLKIK